MKIQRVAPIGEKKTKQAPYKPLPPQTIDKEKWEQEFKKAIDKIKNKWYNIINKRKEIIIMIKSLTPQKLKFPLAGGTLIPRRRVK